MHPLAKAINPEAWAQPDMARALYDRDIGAVYRILHRYGVTRRTIAVIADHNESEVSDIVNGRTVRSYDVLARIADAFGIARGRMGMASSYPEERHSEDDEDMRRRELFALAAAAAAGATLPEWAKEWVGDRPIPVAPKSVGLPDIEHIEQLRGTLGNLNELYGSASQHQATLALWDRAASLLNADMADATRRKLLSVCSRLATTAGWSSADMGDNHAAQAQFDRALTYAHDAQDPTQVARALAFAGRSELQWGAPNYALKLFQFGGIAADRARSHLLRATIEIHGAQAAIKAGWSDTARRMVSVAEDEYGEVTRSDPATPYPWGDIASARAAVRFFLGNKDGAVDDMLTAQDEVESERARSQAFRHARTSQAHLGAGNREEGIAAGFAAVEAAHQVRSARVRGRLAPVATLADHYTTSDARGLAHEVRELTGHGASTGASFCRRSPHTPKLA